jgi:hypothetical protein
MPTVQTFFPICRTMENLTFYLWEGKNFVRKKSRLTAKRVKTSPKFERTRYYAGLMAQASQIGSSLFRLLPVRWRQSWMYRTFTGEAVKLLKEGKTVEEAKEILWALYVKEVVEKAGGWQGTSDNGFAFADPGSAGTAEKAKRSYTKRNTSYWLNKTVKPGKREIRKAKLQRYSGLLARASVIGSVVYKSLPVERRKHALYKALTGSAMELLKEEWADDEVKVFLMEKVLACASAKAEGSKRTVYKVNSGKAPWMYGHHTGIQKRRSLLMFCGNSRTAMIIRQFLLRSQTLHRIRHRSFDSLQANRKQGNAKCDQCCRYKDPPA